MLYAITVTVLAGLSTGIGGIFALLMKRPTEKIMAFSLGFAAGVMITVSLADMLPHSVHEYTGIMQPPFAVLSACSLCAIGMFIAMLLSSLVPEIQPSKTLSAQNAKVLKSAVVTTLAIMVHNLPEGVLTLFTSVEDPQFGASLALAVALHNIPEGIAIAVPIYYATGSKAKGFFYALVSGIAEPIGALLAFGLLSKLLSMMFINGIIAGIAGIMLFVSFDELLPQAFYQNRKSSAILGVCIGIMVMLVGIYLV